MGSNRSVSSPVAKPACVYLLHFVDGSHYIGVTSIGVSNRLRRHLAGYGSTWVYRKALLVGPPEVGAVEWWPSMSSALNAERRHKRHRAKLYSKCEVCRRLKYGEGEQSVS